VLEAKIYVRKRASLGEGILGWVGDTPPSFLEGDTEGDTPRDTVSPSGAVARRIYRGTPLLISAHARLDTKPD
jgi:hypothetical protein